MSGATPNKVGVLSKFNDSKRRSPQNNDMISSSFYNYNKLPRSAVGGSRSLYIRKAQLRHDALN